jgi:hypothetical protein
MKVRHWPIIIASGLLWGCIVAALFLVIAAALATTSHALSIAGVALSAILGLAVLAGWMRCCVEADAGGVTVRRFLRPTTIPSENVAAVRAEVPRSDSGTVFRSFFAVVYPYLITDSGRRIRLTPAGSFAWNPFMREVGVGDTSANAAVTDILGQLQMSPSRPVT